MNVEQNPAITKRNCAPFLTIRTVRQDLSWPSAWCNQPNGAERQEERVYKLHLLATACVNIEKSVGDCERHLINNSANVHPL